jgi:hypothetical protein
MDIDKLIKYESGEMNDEEQMEFFASLIKDGTCWNLQGHYGRCAKNYIDNGFISIRGEITDAGRNAIEQY